MLSTINKRLSKALADNSATLVRIAKTKMSEVFRLEHDGQHLALKLAAASKHPAVAENLLREIELLQQHRHPGVINIVTHGMCEGRPWYATPWLERCYVGAAAERTLTAFEDGIFDIDPPSFSAQRSKPKSIDHIGLNILRHVCDTLAWLHGRGVVHRDIKPRNILIDKTGYPVLIDFGAAVRTADRTGRDQLAFDLGIIGTRGYMSPEQRRGEMVDARSDLYSIGCLLFEILTSEPFHELDLHGSTTLLPSHICPNISPEFDALVAQLLNKNRNGRLAFAEDIAKRLEVLGACPARSNLPTPQPYLYRPNLVGRKHWIERAEREREQAGRGQGHIIVLTGSSGCGKTRLAQEFGVRERRHRRHVIITRCSEDGRTAGPLHAFSPLLHRIALLCHADGQERTRELLPPQAHLLIDAEPMLAGLVDAPKPEERRNIRPEVTAEHVRTAMLTLLHNYAQITQPLILIDDVQWADELSLAVLNELSMRPEVAPHATFVLTMRSEEPFAGFNRFQNNDRVKIWPLEILDTESIVAMVRGMTAVQPPPQTLTDSVVRDCAGNPLFVVSYLRQAINSGALKREDSNWRFDGKAALSMPCTLEELLTRRLAQLSPPSLRFIEAAAILGPGLDWEIATALSDIDKQTLNLTRVEITTRHIVSNSANGELWFSHDKLHEQAYSMIEPNRLSQLHARAAELLGLSAGYAERARHLKMAGRHSEAWFDYLDAADGALKQGRPKRARSMLREARGLNTHRRDNERALLLEAQAVFAARDYRASGHVAKRGLRALGFDIPAGSTEWLLKLGRATGRLALLPFSTAEISLGSEDANAERARTIAFLYFLLHFHYLHENRILEHLTCTLTSAGWAARGGDWGEAANHGASMAFALGFVGLHNTAESWFKRATQWAQRSGDPVRELHCYTMRAGHLAIGMKWERAEELALLVRAQCAEFGTCDQRAYTAYLCATIAMLRGQMARARNYAREMIKHSRFGDLDQIVGEGRCLLGSILLQDGELESAEREALDGANMLEGSGEIAVRASCLAVAAAAAARRGDWHNALRRSLWVQKKLSDGGAKNILAITVNQLLPEVLLALALRESSAVRHELLRRCERAVISCERQARLVKFLQPTALRQRATLLLAKGRTWRGVRRLERAILYARRGCMPFEEAEALRILAYSNAVSATRRQNATIQARTIFQSLGCQWHLKQISGWNRA